MLICFALCFSLLLSLYISFFSFVFLSIPLFLWVRTELALPPRTQLAILICEQDMYLADIVNTSVISGDRKLLLGVPGRTLLSTFGWKYNPLRSHAIFYRMLWDILHELSTTQYWSLRRVWRVGVQRKWGGRHSHFPCCLTVIRLVKLKSICTFQADFTFLLV